MIRSTKISLNSANPNVAKRASSSHCVNILFRGWDNFKYKHAFFAISFARNVWISKFFLNSVYNYKERVEPLLEEMMQVRDQVIELVVLRKQLLLALERTRVQTTEQFKKLTERRLDDKNMLIFYNY
jgi:hypothetical protein